MGECECEVGECECEYVRFVSECVCVGWGEGTQKVAHINTDITVHKLYMYQGRKLRAIHV